MLDLYITQPRILGNDRCPEGGTQHEQEGTDTSAYGGDEECKSELDNTKDESEGCSARADKDQATSCFTHPMVIRVVLKGRGRNDVHSLNPKLGWNITNHTSKRLHRVSKSGRIANPRAILLVATSVVHAVAVILPETLESSHMVCVVGIVQAACTGVCAALETVSIAKKIETPPLAS